MARLKGGKLLKELVLTEFDSVMTIPLTKEEKIAIFSKGLELLITIDKVSVIVVPDCDSIDIDEMMLNYKPIRYVTSDYAWNIWIQIPLQLGANMNMIISFEEL